MRELQKFGICVLRGNDVPDDVPTVGLFLNDNDPEWSIPASLAWRLGRALIDFSWVASAAGSLQRLEEEGVDAKSRVQYFLAALEEIMEEREPDLPPGLVMAKTDGLIVRAASVPDGAQVLPILTWPCARCQDQPVLTPTDLCGVCRGAQA